jgi:hypothetical protein
MDERRNDLQLTADQREHLEHLRKDRHRIGCIWCLERLAHGGTGIEALDRRLIQEAGEEPGAELQGPAGETDCE